VPVDRIREVNWSKRLLAASTISIVGLLAVGILGGRAIYKQNKATEQALELRKYELTRPVRRGWRV
jgi:hypothetical protein